MPLKLSYRCHPLSAGGDGRKLSVLRGGHSLIALMVATLSFQMDVLDEEGIFTWTHLPLPYFY